MPSPTNVGEFYTKFSSDYDQNRFSSLYHQRMAKYEQKFILSNLSPGGNVLEVGAGTGRFTQELVNIANDVVAVDISDGMLSILRAKIPAENLLTKQLDILKLSSLPGYGTFDYVVCMRLLPHLSDIPEALRLLHGSVRDGGVVIFDMWNNKSFVGLIRRIRRVKSQVFTKFTDYPNMLKQIQDAGLRVRTSAGWGFPHMYYFQLDKYLYRFFKRWAYSVVFITDKE
jgi:ubiquinone/menaquinone biosynthesis C-methylase UbiE